MEQKQIQKSPHLGFTSLDNEKKEINLINIGTIPSWITGSILYIGPAKFETSNSKVNHLFDGLSMLHSFSFCQDQATYSNSFLKTNSYYNYLKKGSLTYEGFAQDPNTSLFKKFLTTFIPSQISNQTKNATFNITKINGKHIALAPFCKPICFNTENLDNPELFLYDDILKNNGYENTHPVYDKHKKELISFIVNLGDPNSLIVYKIKDGSQTREIISSIRMEKLHYIQGLSVTKRYIILTLCPLIAQSTNFLVKSKPFIKNFKWEPKLGTTFIVIDRESGEILEKNITTPFFSLHKLNAYEHENTIILDMISYSDCSFIDQFYFENISNRQNIFNSGQLVRYKIILNQSKIWSEIISNCRIDFPTINQQYITNDYKYVYGAEFSPYTISRNYNKLIKINVKSHEIQDWFEPYCYPGVPIFIPKPNSKSEDDGVIVSIVLDTVKKISFLLMLEASTFTEIARAYIPHHIPFGLTGIYCN